MDGKSEEPPKQREPANALGLTLIPSDFDVPDAEILRLFEGECTKCVAQSEIGRER